MNETQVNGLGFTCFYQVFWLWIKLYRVAVMAGYTAD